ncbi:hypothetical protein [Gelidibacter salicanalis]|uniref:Uncharacterized protein n=1 Tax=Gelidibacter salicanalis TaxID=291193 RepID=A0A934KVD3_9FLAO|nr:hypothetical protein [Gelidibacter salicanalis]MBJ7880943.1 hypothetical protein [Gelidibacter salicanalis]
MKNTNIGESVPSTLVIAENGSLIDTFRHMEVINLESYSKNFYALVGVFYQQVLLNIS